MMLATYEKYRAAGFACVPTSKEKIPAIPKGSKFSGNWDGLEDYKKAYGIGLICGEVSGGLECLDFDNHFKDADKILQEFLLTPDISEIYEKNRFPIQSTVSGGFHVIYKCSSVNGSEKLAMRMNDKGKSEAIIESRGKGNYFVVDPTPGYKINFNDIFKIPTITPEDREILFSVCRSYNSVYTSSKSTTYEETEDRPGDIYNQSPESLDDMKKTLKSGGWVELEDNRWRRPGKDKGISATLGIAHPGIFYNFSSNADPFELKTGYTAFQVVGLLKYGGDFSAFAKELYEKQSVKQKFAPPPINTPDEYEKLRARLRIDPTSDIKEPPVCCFIGGCPSMTLGNFSMVDGKKKAGKTFSVGGVVAAMLSNSLQIGKIKGNLSRERNTILYFDTEQSPYHATRSIKRICKLAGTPNPSNLIAFGLRPLNPVERLSFIEKTIQITETLAAVIIDGVRDLLTKGINDEPEATTLTSSFLKWTENYNIHMILLLHQNKNDLNARGHIGTELGNKAETIITVTKDKKSNIFIVGCEDSKDIGFDEFAFTVDESGMILSSDMPREEQTKAKNPQYIDDQKHFEVLDSICKSGIQLNYSGLQDAIIYGFDNTFGRSASRAFITHYLEKGWIKNERNGMKTFYTYNHAAF